MDNLLTLRPEFLLQLGLAALLGGMIGLERELNGKPAGFRTNLLICVGSALLTALSISIAQGAAPIDGRADPARIAAQIVTGVGFLGAGTIMQARGSVVGLTTAATLWVVAAIGIAVGAAAYEEAIGTTALVMLALLVLGKLEDAVFRRRTTTTLRVSFRPDGDMLEEVDRILGRAGYQVRTEEVQKTDELYVATLQVTGRRRHLEQTLRILLEHPRVRAVSQL